MKVTARQVKELRDRSGAGMMDCREALLKTGGDMDAAVRFLREKGRGIIIDRFPKTAAEGLCLIASEGNRKAAVVEVNSETDFVARNELFRTFVMNTARQALESSAADLDAFLKEAWIEDPSVTVQEALGELQAVIKEKLVIRRFERVTAQDGMLATYVHAGGRIGVIVDARTDVVNEAVAEALKNVAMQVAAMSPRYVSEEEIPEEYRAREKEILLARALKENDELPENKRKPQNIIEKMLAGRLKKEFREICLNDQVYVRAEDGRQTVAEYLARVGEDNGTAITIRRFVRFETGEGMEKRRDNFAQEVMAQVGG